MSRLSISVFIPMTRATDHVYNRKSFKNKSGEAGQTRGGAQRNKTMARTLPYYLEEYSCGPLRADHTYERWT